jgi:pyruvate dehydrogenase E2 component (dihydrolipoamide acetyltransferase)
MPKLGFDMAEGKLVRKVKKEGEAVNKGDIIAEIETDKATVEVDTPVGGVVKGWLVEEGQPVPVGANMAVIGAPDEVVDVSVYRVQPPGAARTIISAPAAASAAQPAPAAPASPPIPAATAPSAPAIPSAPAVSGRVAASPIARRIADEAGIDIRLVAGTGPGGRITKKDVEAFLRAPRPAPLPSAPIPSILSAPSVEDTTLPLTKLRQIIARRMTESKQTVPHIYITAEIDMAPAMDLRKQINALLPDERKVSVNDFVVKATALALRQFPNLNASFAGDKVIRKGRVNVGVAVAVEGGLLTVVAKDADAKPLAQIAAEVRAMAARARAGKVQPADIEGSTFSTSNLGMSDVTEFAPVINPPEAGILAIGAVREAPVVKDGALASGLRLKVTCAADHRVTDGAEVAQFLQAVKKNLEEPLRLLIADGR